MFCCSCSSMVIIVMIGSVANFVSFDSREKFSLDFDSCNFWEQVSPNLVKSYPAVQKIDTQDDVFHHIIHRVRPFMFKFQVLFQSRRQKDFVFGQLWYLQLFCCCCIFLLRTAIKTVITCKMAYMSNRRRNDLSLVSRCFFASSSYQKNPIFAQIFAITLLCDKAAAISRLFTFGGRRTRLQKLVSNE